MNWPLDESWACETCGERILIWGMVHGVCRCDECHTVYRMRDGTERVTTPINCIDSKWYPAYKKLWDDRHETFEAYTDEELVATGLVQGEAK